MDEEERNSYLFMVAEKQKIKGKTMFLNSRHLQWIILGLMFAIFALTCTLAYYIAKAEHSIGNSGNKMNNLNQYF